ncbi:MAG: DUF721 domain-containing protein [Desulfosalsimonas sp.]
MILTESDGKSKKCSPRLAGRPYDEQTNTMSRPRYRNDQFSHISDVLSALVGQLRRESHSDLYRIQQIWNSVLDPVIAENSRPAALKNDILLVHVASSTVTQQMRFITPQIIEQINRGMGDDRISRIQYKIGTISPSDDS